MYLFDVTICERGLVEFNIQMAYIRKDGHQRETVNNLTEEIMQMGSRRAYGQDSNETNIAYSYKLQEVV